MSEAITPDRILTVACDLLSDDGENSEYDRALVEMSCALLRIDSAHKEDLALVLRNADVAIGLVAAMARKVS